MYYQIYTLDNQSAITFIGKPCVQGAYLLRLHLATSLAVTFGRFHGGRPIAMAAGDYFYIGSALGQRGATSLAGRLLRHTTRSGDLPPHTIRPVLRVCFQEQGLMPAGSVAPPPTKRLFWHIDYLVDRVEAEISQIFIIPTADRVEPAIAQVLAADPVVTTVAPGLGASDDPHATHLLRVDAQAEWWHNLPQQLAHVAATHRNEEANESATPYPQQ